MPTEQGRERCPIRRAIPGSVEQREFEDTRHGPVQILTFLMVHTGRREAAIREANDAVHLIPALEVFRRQPHRLRGVFQVLDGGGSLIAGERTRSFARCGGWERPRLTPAHASWLNQGEILNHVLGLHVMASWPEDNRLYAHPFKRTRRNPESRRGFAEHAP
jgi:hypothetical protein